jgi:hypothetical protein
MLPIPTNTILDPINIMGNYPSAQVTITSAREITISSDIGLVGHENDIVEIIQEINDIVNAIFGGIARVCIAYTCKSTRFSELGITERSVVKEDDVVKCVSESFMIGPDFAHGRLNRVRLNFAGIVEIADLGFVVEDDSVQKLGPGSCRDDTYGRTWSLNRLIPE